jgi:RNA polymerase sigma factor (sigma-70 family)
VSIDEQGVTRDSAWFADVFDAYSGQVYRFLRRRMLDGGSVVDADDLTAEVFAVTWRRRADIPHDAILAWLYGVARNVLAAHARRQPSTTVAIDDDADDYIDEMSDPAELVTDSVHLREAWQQLSARERQVLALVAWEGLSEESVAEVLGIKIGSASSAISRARQRFRELLS